MKLLITVFWFMLVKLKTRGLNNGRIYFAWFCAHPFDLFGLRINF